MATGTGFEDGDLVTLASGGPVMTVEHNRRDGIVSTVRFGKDGELHYEAFKPESLRLLTARERKRLAPRPGFWARVWER